MQPMEPLHAHHPTVETLNCYKEDPVETQIPRALADINSSTLILSSEIVQESIHDILEYLDMIALASPRILATDHTDPFLSRYSVPDPLNSNSAVRTIKWN